MVHAEYRVDFRDFMDSMKAYRRVAKGAAFIYYLDVWIVPTLGALITALALITYFEHDSEAWANLSWLPYVGVPLMFVTVLVYRVQLYHAYRQRVSLTNNSEIQLHFDDEHVRFTIPGKTEVKYAWSAFTFLAETSRTGTLLVGRAAFHTIPKSALHEGEWSKLRSHFATRGKGL